MKKILTNKQLLLSLGLFWTSVNIIIVIFIIVIIIVIQLKCNFKTK